MKVIVTGATGFVGREAVAQCIANPEISSILVLTRRNIDETLSQSSKVHVILHQDFQNYPPALLEQLKGSHGCIWCLGGKVEDFPNVDAARKVGVDFTLAAANAFAIDLAPAVPRGQKFRFVYCSGKGAEWEQQKNLWVFSDTRKLKGAAERGLLDIADSNPQSFVAVLLRPGGVLPDGSEVVRTVASLVTPVVSVSQLAIALVRACIQPPAETVIQNPRIIELGS